MLQPIEIGKKWIAAFNSHDLEGILSLYAEDARHTSPKLRAQGGEGCIHGKGAMRVWWGDCFRRMPDLRYVDPRYIADESAVVVVYTRHNPGDKEMRVAEILEIQQEGIVSSCVYHG